MAMDTVLDGRVGTPPAAVVRGEMRDWVGGTRWTMVEMCSTGGIILPASFHLPEAALAAVDIHRQLNT